MLTRAFTLAAYVVGMTGAGIFSAYVFATGTGILTHADQAADGVFPWLADLGLLVLFALQHSGMARQTFKQLLPRALERSSYVASSGVFLAALALLWQPLPGAPLWRGPLWIAAFSLLGAGAMGLCCLWFDHLAFFGLRQASGKLRIEGPYRFVRHPLMLGMLISLWAQPIMPPELLMLNVGLTLYILLAIRLEERDLLREFGAAYGEYRRQVPALIPYRIFV